MPEHRTRWKSFSLGRANLLAIVAGLALFLSGVVIIALTTLDRPRLPESNKPVQPILTSVVGPPNSPTSQPVSRTNAPSATFHVSSTPQTAPPPPTVFAHFPAQLPAVVVYSTIPDGYGAAFQQALPSPCDTIAVASNPFYVRQYAQYAVWYGVVGGRYLQVCGGNDSEEKWVGIVAVRSWEADPRQNGDLSSSVPYTDTFHKVPDSTGNLVLVSVEQNHILNVWGPLISGYRYFDLEGLTWISKTAATFVSPADITVLLPDWTLNVTREQYNQQLEKWRSHKTNNYELRVEVSGADLPWDKLGEYYLEVHGGKALIKGYFPLDWPTKPNPESSSIPTRTPAPTPDRSDLAQGFTVEGQFAKLDNMLRASVPPLCHVDFDPAYGFPSYVQCKKRADDVFTYTTVKTSLSKGLKQGTNLVPVGTEVP